MKRIIELILVIAYNLSLLAGASYLIVAHDFSPWIYLLVLMFGATWGDRDPIIVEVGK